MQKYFNNVTNRTGDVVPGAIVTVTLAATGALATIYSDNGVTAKANPITADNNGYFSFYAADGEYSITFNGAGFGPLTIAGILLADVAAQATAAAASAAAAQQVVTNIGGNGGSALVGYLPAGAGAVTSTVQAALRDLSAQGGGRHIPFANDYSTGTVVVRDGSADTYHRHFGQIAEGLDGRLHLIYRRSTQHALTDGATIYYCYSDDGGSTWSAETVFAASVAGFDQRGMSMCVTPSGRIVVIYDKCPVPAAAPTVFRLRYSDDNGATWTQGPDVASVAYSYARSYGRIKSVPAGTTRPGRLLWTPYYQSSATPTYKSAVWYSDDDGYTWAEGTPIVDSTGSDNETEAVAISAKVWLSASRGASGLMLRKSVDGGASWTDVGIVPLTSTDSYVAPSLDKFKRDGKWYVLLGYCNRTSTTDAMTWRIAEVSEALASASAFGGAIVVATDMENASGYQAPVVRADSGEVYIDGGTAYVEFKEYTGFAYSQVRFVRMDLPARALNAPRSLTVASDAITVPDTWFDATILLDTEASAATDDLATINGGREGQVVILQSATSSRDVTLRNGTGNLQILSDFRLNTAGTSGSRIALIKSGARWLELTRSNDNVSTASVLTIATDAVTVPSSRAVLPLLIDTEAAAATDDLSTINGGLDGQIVILTSATSSRDPTIKDSVGNINTAGDFTLTNAADAITLIKRGATWYEISRSDNAV